MFCLAQNIAINMYNVLTHCFHHFIFLFLAGDLESCFAFPHLDRLQCMWCITVSAFSVSLLATNGTYPIHGKFSLCTRAYNPFWNPRYYSLQKVESFPRHRPSTLVLCRCNSSANPSSNYAVHVTLWITRRDTAEDDVDVEFDESTAQLNHVSVT